MLKINLMPSFINRLKDRGWKKIPSIRYTVPNTQILRRNNKNIICVECINVDSSVDIQPQIDGFFNTLIEMLNDTVSVSDIFLPGGGDIAIPNFFKDFCANKININVVTDENINNLLNDW